jgi:hypothetical protein
MLGEVVPGLGKVVPELRELVPTLRESLATVRPKLVAPATVSASFGKCIPGVADSFLRLSDAVLSLGNHSPKPRNCLPALGRHFRALEALFRGLE